MTHYTMRSGKPSESDGCVHDQVYSSMSANIKLRDLLDSFILFKFRPRNGRSSLRTHMYFRLSLVFAENTNGFLSARETRTGKKRDALAGHCRSYTCKKRKIDKYFGGIFHKVISSIVGI